MLEDSYGGLAMAVAPGTYHGGGHPCCDDSWMVHPWDSGDAMMAKAGADNMRHVDIQTEPCDGDDGHSARHGSLASEGTCWRHTRRNHHHVDRHTTLRCARSLAAWSYNRARLTSRMHLYVRKGATVHGYQNLPMEKGLRTQSTVLQSTVFADDRQRPRRESVRLKSEGQTLLVSGVPVG